MSVTGYTKAGADATFLANAPQARADLFGSQEALAAIAAVDQSPAVSFIPTGDSHTAYTGGLSIATPPQSTSPQIFDGKGMHAWLRVYMAGDMRMIGNAGIGGQTSTQIAARFDTDVLAYKPAIVCILAGTNDRAEVEFVDANDTVTVRGHGASVGDTVAFGQIASTTGVTAGTVYYVKSVPSADTFTIAATAGGATIALTNDGSATTATFNPGTPNARSGTQTTIGNLKAMYAKASNAGILVMATTIPPSTTSLSGQETHRLRVNQWIRSYARSNRGIVLADLAAAWQDPTLSGFKPVPAYVHDGVHASMLGAAVGGRVMADALRPFVPKNRKNAAPAVAPFNVLTNPHFTGSIGTTDANTKNVGGAWFINNISNGVTVTTAKRTDGLNGNYVEIVVPSGQSFSMTTNVSVDGTKLSAGDRIALNVTAQVSGIETGSVMRSMGASIQQYDGSSFGDKAFDIYSDGGVTPASPGWYGAGAAHPDGIYGFSVPDVTVGAGRTIVQVSIGAQGGGTYRFYGAQLENLTKIAAL